MNSTTAQRTLLSAQTLAAHQADARWLAIDCRFDLTRPEAGRADYLQAHIPGARYLHLDEDLAGARNGRNGRHPLPDPQRLADRLGENGVSADTQVVAYDAQGGLFAARLWWLLRWLGHDKAAVLDGGWQAWQAAQQPVESGDARLATPAHSDVQLRPLAAHIDEVLVCLHTPRMQIVDARSADRFRGENETLDPIGGHIPGARNRFFKTNLQADGRFKPAEVLRDEWQSLLAGSLPGAIVHQCGSGVSACHNLLAMEIAGLHGSRLYPGSWSEWCADPARPVARGTDSGEFFG
jgi:thiosulfate/3-mercaptopyruvate sulfurtransferase